MWKLDRCNKLYHSSFNCKGSSGEFHLRTKKEWRQNKNCWLIHKKLSLFVFTWVTHSWCWERLEIRVDESKQSVESGGRGGWSGVNIIKSRVRVKHALRLFIQSRVVFTVFFLTRVTRERVAKLKLPNWSDIAFDLTLNSSWWAIEKKNTLSWCSLSKSKYFEGITPLIFDTMNHESQIPLSSWWIPNFWWLQNKRSKFKYLSSGSV